MLPQDFAFHRPTTLQEALDLLSDNHGDLSLLGGGMSLLPLINLGVRSPQALVSLTRVADLSHLDRDGEVLRIGAACTHTQLAADEQVRSSARILAEAAGLIADPQVRNRGTIGGSLAQAHPGGEYLTVLSAMNAEVEVRTSTSVRHVAVRELVLDRLQTVLTPAELISQVQVPVLGADVRSAYLRFSRVQGNYSTVNVAVVVRPDESLTLAIGGALTRPVVVESRLGADVAALAVSACAGAYDDHMASAAYRQAMAGVLTRRVISSALAPLSES